MNATLMKTCALTAFAIAAMSCAKEQAVENGLPAEVSFAIEAPSGISTKANGDGSLAKDLYYQVFDKDMNPISGLNLQQKDLVNGKTTVQFQLVKDQVYNFIFWAQTEKSDYYTFDKAVGGEGLKKITANYDTHKAANDENRDAFFAVVKELKIDGPLTQNVKLTRPFAQINIGADDKLSDGSSSVGISEHLTGATSSFSVKQIPTVFSPMDGTVSEPEDVAFEAAAIPGATLGVTLSVKDATYEYLSMNYVFAPAERSVYDISATFQFDGKEVSFSSPTTPLQRNYRTNIVGSLLTNTADFNVEVDPNFGGDEVVTVWDGTSVTAVTEVDGVYEISNAAELAWVAQQVNAGTTFSGKTVKLVNDINLGYKAWTPIGGCTKSPTITFHGTFDGNGKTISNLYASDNTAKDASAGLFGGMTSALVKNLTIKNATINSTHFAGVICGYVQCSSISNCKVSNVKVTSTAELLSDGKYDNGDKVGGIAGLLTESNNEGSAVTGCTVENAKIQGYRDIGGIVGYANNYFSVTGNKLEGSVIIKVDGSHNYKGYTTQSDYDANAYVGEKAASATVSDNTGEATIDFSDAFIAGYSESGTAVALPAGPDMSGDVVNVTAANAQYTLDGAYGSIDGKTINFTENISETLVLGRPNRFPGSNTKYMVGGYTSDASGYQEFATAEELAAYKAQTSWTPGCYYTRAVNNVKFTASEGVEINGINATSGHIYGTTENLIYDYVLDNGTSSSSTSPSYYDAYNFENISFEGITFVKNAQFYDSSKKSSINKLTFSKCNFLALREEDQSTQSRGQRVKVQRETDSEYLFDNIIVDNCSFYTSFQGVYVSNAHNVKVSSCKIITTVHNAIAIQSNYKSPNYGAVVIENNTFDKIGDRVIRFGDIGADTQITITGNIATNSGDSEGEVMKASTLASGITYDIHDNDWGGGTVANNELEDKVTE